MWSSDLDAQTSGGLLLAVGEKDAMLAVKRLKEVGYEHSAIVGSAVSKSEFGIFLR